jgi:hypothetical protein
VSKTGLAGKWRNLKSGRKQFRTNDGGILNWWETIGTITFQLSPGRIAADRANWNLSEIDVRQLRFPQAVRNPSATQLRDRDAHL